MKRVFTTVAIICILIASFFTFTHYTFAETHTEADKRSAEIKSKIADLEKQLDDARGKEKTLKSQLAYIDTQSALTTLKIEETQEQVAKLEQEIGDLSGRITKLSTTVDKMTELLLNRIVQTYKYGNYTTLDLLFSSHGFTDLLLRAKYLQTAQQNDKKILYQLQATKAAYNDQKVDKETRQAQQERLKRQLEGYQVQLAEQKVQKNQLLNAVQNDTTKFQARIKELENEVSQIQQAANLLISTEPRKVAKGEIIGLMGNTGYSSGAHLHFGVYNITSLSQYNYYSNYENPTNVLKSTTVKWWEAPNCDDRKGSYQDKLVGAGSWDWPMDIGSLRITQGFGDTCYTGKLYGGKPHPAFDMVNNSNIFVRAVEEGQAYFCRNCLGDGGNGVFVFHLNGKMTLYWHLQ